MKVFAAINFLSSDEGGRDRPLSAGTYYPTTTVTENGQSSTWSLVLELIDQDDKGVWYATCGFLAEAAPFHLLRPEYRLDLYEGPHLVGNLRVLMPANVVKEVYATAP